jgi:hypothetical protein
MFELMGTCPTCDVSLVGDCSLPPTICPIRFCEKCGASGMWCSDCGRLGVWYSHLGETIEGSCICAEFE